MPKHGGARASKLKTLATAAFAVILYAAPVWCSAMRHQKYRGMLEKVQRRMLIRICGAYRTTSTAALQVLAEILPMELLVMERARVYKRGRGEKKVVRNEVMEEWQRMWEQIRDQAQWTRRLIPDVRAWVSRGHGEMSFYLTQALSGHGYFQAYLQRVGKIESAGCVYCTEDDTPMHTLFVCNRWDRQRQKVITQLGGTLTTDNMVPLMLISKEKWNVVEDYIYIVMKTKEKEERERQRQPRQQNDPQVF